MLGCNEILRRSSLLKECEPFPPTVINNKEAAMRAVLEHHGVLAHSI